MKRKCPPAPANPPARPDRPLRGRHGQMLFIDGRKLGHILTSGRCAGAPLQVDAGEPFEETMQRFVPQLRRQQSEAARLDTAIHQNLKELGF